MGNSELLFETIFKRKISDSDNKAFFTQIAEAHPYFSVAQYYLLLQTDKESSNYSKQAAKTSLLFNNPFWLQFQLGDTLLDNTNEDIASLSNITISEKIELVNAIPIEQKNGFPEIIQVEKQEAEITPKIELNNTDQRLEIINTPEPVSHFNESITPLVNDIEQEDDSLSDQRINPFNFKFNLNTSEVTEDKITFEPLHTSDYFASLGIKLSGKILHSDKLGKQMKSFTEWLKEIKKLQPDQLPLQSEQADLTIQKLAEASNLGVEVETEAMAEVLIQQGKKQKALNVYKKLSLLDPSKSAYFAAKINQLKDY
jgi:hypothetical protein